MKAELFWISGRWHGKLAIASSPRGGDWLQDEAAAWRRAGLDVVVSLLEEEDSGLIAAGALMSLGFGAEEAIHSVSLARELPIPETPAQHEWLRHLPAGHPAEKFSD